MIRRQQPLPRCVHVLRQRLRALQVTQPAERRRQILLDPEEVWVIRRQEAVPCCVYVLLQLQRALEIPQ